MITVLLVLNDQGRFVLTITNTLSRTLRIGVAGSALVLALTACGGTKWGFPYRPHIQQGNWITAEQVEQLQPGMTREQVRFILGTPTLQDIFRSDRWDYPYYNQPGYGEPEQRRFSVWFEGDSLVRWEGDSQPNRQPFESGDTGRSAVDDHSSVVEATPSSTNRDSEPLR